MNETVKSIEVEIPVHAGRPWDPIPEPAWYMRRVVREIMRVVNRAPGYKIVLLSVSLEDGKSAAARHFDWARYQGCRVTVFYSFYRQLELFGVQS